MWKDGVIEVNDAIYYWLAKVYAGPSQFGINGGPVSKLSICTGPCWNYANLIYNYDRGPDIDIDDCNPDIIEAVLDHLEKST